MKEKSEEYNLKANLSSRPVKYLSDSVRARSMLETDVVRHIDQCFTKKGMRKAKGGGKKRSPRNKIQVRVNDAQDMVEEGELPIKIENVYSMNLKEFSVLP